MDRALVTHPPAVVRAYIARQLVGDDPPAEPLGEITLLPHQRDAVSRVRAAIDRFGGALLADEVGLGKTYVAAAIARAHARALVVAPTPLVAMWREALRRTGATAHLVTFGMLSRGRAPPGVYDLVIIDEAHHARNPATRRYALLARLTRDAHTLLLSATPVHNRGRDLDALLALFLGARARTLDPGTRAACIVRREHGDLAAHVPLPRLTAPRRLDVGDDEDVLRHILALPPPVPPRDGGAGGALLAWSLVRQWASSRAALDGALSRRLLRATALSAALTGGRLPNRRELGAWVCADAAVQLAFTELVTAEATPAAQDLLVAVDTHAAAVRALRDRLRRDDAPDARRAARFAEVRHAHPGERVLAFASFADTVRALWQRVRGEGAVAALSARGGLVAGGTLSRREVLARFAPHALGSPPPGEADRIECLLTTDLSSEGLDLHDASVVVHLDLPWTPARLEQRVGRSRRVGAAHACTTVYAFAPPARAEALLEVERRLREKLRAAARAVGMTGAILPRLLECAEPPSAARVRELAHARLRAWVVSARADDLDSPVVAVVRGGRPALLALVRVEGAPMLIASVADAPLSDDPAIVLAALTLAEGDAIAGDVAGVRDALAAAERWVARHAATRAADGTLLCHPGPRRAALRRIDAITARTPRHRLAALGALVQRARRVVTGRYGVGAEHVLAHLAASALPDEAWLRAIGSFGDAHAGRATAADESASSVVLALVLVRQP